MPLILPQDLPAYRVLEEENIFVMPHLRAHSQDIRPLRILIVNLMPKKIQTEIQLLRMLANTPLQLDITFIHPSCHKSKNTSSEHLARFYKSFEEIKSEKFDGAIITGAPVESLPFEEVDYWDELVTIMEFCKNSVYSTMFICWAFQAGLYYFYGIDKMPLKQKLFGIYPHKIVGKSSLVRGFDDVFYMPQSRHTSNDVELIAKEKSLDIIALSEECGVYMCIDKTNNFIFVSGHGEYERRTLEEEYLRDKSQGKDINLPKNYYPFSNPAFEPKVSWRAHSNLLFANWLNYQVYQDTPFDIKSVKSHE